jgi:hypothetical protein
MAFSIAGITPSKLDVVYDGQQYTVHGEALDKDVGGLDYVIYAQDFHYSDPARKGGAIPVATQIAVLDQLKAELLHRGWAIEVDGEAQLRGATSIGAQVGGVIAGQPCPREGWWVTPAKTNSRRHFKAGEVMPDVGGDYGATIWQWDDKQDA